MFRFGAMLRDKGKAALNEGDLPGPVRSNSRGLIERALPPISRSHPLRNLHPHAPEPRPRLARARAGLADRFQAGRARGPARMGPLRPLPGHGQPGFRAATSPGPRPSARPSPRPTAARSTRLARSEDAAHALGTAVLRYEAIEDLLGRIMSYAGLVYSGDTTDPKRAKFYGDTQERLTAASSELLFFTLELNRIDDAVLDAAMQRGAACPLPALARGPPQGQALPARGQDRAAVPRKVGHRAGLPGTAFSTRPSRRSASTVRGEELTLEPTLNKLQDADENAPPGRRRGARQDVPGESAHLHAHHQHAVEGQGDLGPLARLRGRRRFAPPREPRRARGRRGARRRGARSLSAPVAPLLSR